MHHARTSADVGAMASHAAGKQSTHQSVSSSMQMARCQRQSIRERLRRLYEPQKQTARSNVC